MKVVYNISIYSYSLAIKIASLFNSKAKLWVAGRKNIFQELQTQLNKLPTPNSQLLWFHCASLGEFEQGRPVMEKVKEKNPEIKILLTFFSPSGYEIRKNYSGADIICYLPIDTPSNARKFISITKPHSAFFVKYEFWFNYLNELKSKNIKAYLVSGIFRKEQHFFKGYGTWFKKQLSCFSQFFVQDENSKSLLNSIGYDNVIVVGDTRFDRVYEISKNVKQFDLVKAFCEDKKILIAGSTWEEDVKIIAEWFENSKLQTPNSKLIIAPHEINQATIQSTIQQLGRSITIKYSEADQSNVVAANILIIDNIGMLSSLYQYGSIAFIGGGFGKGIHNILEAATFGLPVVFGPNYQKFSEAKELIKLGGAFSINSIIEFEKCMELFNDILKLKMASDTSKKYILENVGATRKIVSQIKI